MRNRILTFLLKSGSKVATDTSKPGRNHMEPLDRDTTKKLFDHYRRHRDDIRNKPEMASICLICGSVHIIPQHDNPYKLFCRDCGFAFYRYQCPACGKSVDGRDPHNPACHECGLRICTCGACGCAATDNNGET